MIIVQIEHEVLNFESWQKAFDSDPIDRKKIRVQGFALLALLIDIFFLLKGNQPINKVFQSWNGENYPENWEEVRKKWFTHYHRRQIAGLMGFFCLLIGAFFR